MKTYKFSNCTVMVFNIASRGFRIAQVYNLAGEQVTQIRTNLRGMDAAMLAESEALRFRML